jgi:DNA gyrase subunit A
MNTKEEDVVTHVILARTHANVLFFTDLGKVFQIKMYDLPEGRRATRGKSINNFIALEDQEKVTSILTVPKGVDEKDLSLSLVTRKGVIKRTYFKDFANVRRNGLIAINLRDGDTLLEARMTKETDDLLIVAKSGQSIRFAATDARAMGRAASGVRGIKLKEGDVVVGTGVVYEGDNENHLLVITEHGYGKRTKLSEYKQQGRGGSGIKAANITVKTGAIVSARVITAEDSEVIAISGRSQVIRTNLADISELGRPTQGVRIMKLRKNDKVASIAIL